MKRRLSLLRVAAAVFICSAMFGLSISTVNAAIQGSKLREYSDCSGSTWCPLMIQIPGGSFMMGSPRTEAGRFDDEDQKLTSIKSFSVSKTPITRGQWAAFVEATGRPIVDAPCAYAQTQHPSWKNPGFAQDDNHPVVCITWGEAGEYVRWLSAKTGHSYRLLTDPEWEYAARAGTTTPFPWGSAASHEFANYGADECCGPAKAGRDQWLWTSPVGSFPPNAFGLFDMHGNVFEWTSTCADSFEKLARPSGSKGCVYRYARGGVYADRPAVMRSAARNYAPPEGDKMSIETYRSAGFGLRVARDN